jgi:hypothetical protein
MYKKHALYALLTVYITVLVMIPVAFQAAALLAAGAHPSHLLNVSSWGFTPLPPSCNLKFLGYPSD